MRISVQVIAVMIRIDVLHGPSYDIGMYRRTHTTAGVVWWRA